VFFQRPFAVAFRNAAFRPVAPGGIYRTHGGIDRMAELVDADALVVVSVEGKRKQVLLSETGGLAPGAPNPLIHVVRVWRVPVLGHVRVLLVLADDDQIHAVLHHRRKDVWTSRQEVRHDPTGAFQGLVRNLAEATTGSPSTSRYFL